MKLYTESDNYKLYQGNMLDMLEVIEANSIDSIVTDPPYELNFMSKKWDNAGISFQKETWQKCYEVLKPGGYLLAFGGSRTFHRIACAIEDAGFEIRDTIMWLYGSGFPKSMNIGLAIDKKNGVESPIINTGKSGVSSRAYQSEKTTTAGQYEIKKAQNKWKGWGSALKPSYEPIIVARKSFKSSLVDNVIKYGVGGINIDECRIETTDINRKGGATTNGNLGWKPSTKTYNAGRFPANTILTYDETDFDEVCGGFPDTKNKNTKGTYSGKNKPSKNINIGGGVITSFYDDSGSASRYFMNCKYTGKDEEIKRYIYTPKANKKDRDCDGTIKNIHPTCKPQTLMQYLVRLVTPNNGIILDPFNGSGSTGKAVMYENKDRKKNYKYIGIELSEEYLEISKARINFALEQNEEQKKEEEDQISLWQD